MKRPSDLLAAFAALMGAGGVVVAAAAAHAGGGDLGKTAAEFLMGHAAALLGIAAAARMATPRRARNLVVVGWGLAAGATLFSVDVARLGFAGTRLFPYAAPLGGSLTILAWLALALAFGLAE